MPETLSAVVVAYNRAAIIGTCLRALHFADEIIVVDKSSTDATPAIAARHADRVITVPWTPTVEDTRAFAVAQCSGDWILCLDDDECLSPGAAAAIRAELAAPRADIYRLPLRHYILGVHDPAAYYWPEHHPRLFRRGAMAFVPTVHGGLRLCSDRIVTLPLDGEVVIHNLSHRDVHEWVEKTNRYTARADRVRVELGGLDLVAFAHARIDHWLARTKDPTPDAYPSVAALLRALYDMIDSMKSWEEDRGYDGAASFAAVCATLDAGYAGDPVVRAGICSEASPGGAPVGDDPAGTKLVARIAALQARYDAAQAEAVRLAEAVAEEAAKRDAAQRERDEMGHALRAAREQLAAIETSTCWRATAGIRRLGEYARRLARRH